jgi:hypothetical protein
MKMMRQTLAWLSSAAFCAALAGGLEVAANCICFGRLQEDEADGVGRPGFEAALLGNLSAGSLQLQSNFAGAV